MEKKTFIKILNYGLMIFSVIVVTTGLMKYPGFLEIFGVNRISLPLGTISKIHDNAGLALAVFVITSLVVRIKDFFGKKKK